MKIATCLMICFLATISYAQFAPAAGQNGTTAIDKDSSVFVNWGYFVTSINLGPEDLSQNSPFVGFGAISNVLGPAEGNSFDVLSLGDGGDITIHFQYPIFNGPGNDFAVFENSVWDDFLELAFVEVSTDGQNFVRFPSTSLTQTISQVATFGLLNPTEIHNFAGKYRQGFGTPFDLSDLSDSTGINLDSINYVRIIDVVGSIDPQYASYDHLGTIVNDPFPTPFESSGFDLDAIGVIHQNNIYASVDQNDIRFEIYPNPASDYLNISVERSNYQVQLFDLNSKLVYSAKDVELINVTHLNSGIYFLILNLSDQQSIKKIIVTH